MAAGEPEPIATVSMGDDIRAAALMRVVMLRELYAGRIPRAALSEGVVADGERILLFNYQKGIFKPAAFGRDGAALSTQTSADSPLTRFARSARRESDERSAHS